MRHRVLIALLLIGVIASQGALGTMAYFSDSGQSASNSFMAWQNTTVHLSPDAGVDETNGTYYLLEDDLDALEFSDENCYQTQNDWDTTFADDEYLGFTFPDIPAGVTIVNVSITLEWSNSPRISEARLKVFDGLGTEQVYALTVADSGSSTETVDLSAFIDTAEKVNNLQVWFQALLRGQGSGPSGQTNHDLVEVTVEYD
ncbi:MAG: hypothetical protein JSW16_05845 [Dehalococcoidales bacterium]|nr:MAG: hypothetical protein JSW16_05845 [Dehalococcoidales bacterium]